MQKLRLALLLLLRGSAAALAFNEEQAVSRLLSRAGLSCRALTALKIKCSEESGFTVFKVEMETPSADYDFVWLQADGSLDAADFELDDEYARAQAAGRVQSKQETAALPAAWLQVPPSCFKLEEQGRCRHQGLKYELELDRCSGLVSDFTAERAE